MTSPIIAETAVLKAVATYLIGRNALPYRFSVPRGKGINTAETVEDLRTWFRKVGFEPEFSSHGADVEALSDTEWWRVECKGLGTGTGQTHRSNFDRAVSSVVSYFEEPPYPIDKQSQNAKLCLGLALPSSPDFLHQLKRRVRTPLRKQLNLWVLLYEPTSGAITGLSPVQDY